MWVEIPDVGYETFSEIKDLTDLFQIYEGYAEKRKLAGSFSKLSKKLMLNTSYGFFDGACKNQF